MSLDFRGILNFLFNYVLLKIKEKNNGTSV